MTASPIRIVLDIDVLEDYPSGIATTAHGTSRSFAGWLGLMSALDALLMPAAESDSPSAHLEPDGVRGSKP
ncbi:MAG: hypothetical protein JO304_13085 [Solirubrobacterales bacterium]|nr:hypothetical protein [Solirubrobacterales bacterium]